MTEIPCSSHFPTGGQGTRLSPLATGDNVNSKTPETLAPASRRRRIAEAATHTDRAALHWVSPTRSALVTLISVIVALQVSGPSVAIPVGIGGFLVGLSDQRGGFADRLRGMTLATILLIISTATGLAVSDSVPLHLVMAAILGGILGYIGIAGPHAALAGVLALVAFAVFSGTPQPIDDITPALFGVLAGAVAQILSVALPLLARRMGGLRTEISIAMRGVAFALRGRDGGAASTNAIAKIAAARTLTQTGGGYGETRRWYEALLDCTDELRMSFLALEGVRGQQSADQLGVLAEVRLATADLLVAASRALELPPLRRRVHPAFERFEKAFGGSRTGQSEVAEAALRRAHAAARELDGMLEGRWPIGRRAKVRFGPQFNLDWLHDMIHRRDPGQLFTRHAVRLAAAMLIATAIAEVEPVNHAYWLPVTVAWVAKPDLAGTAERVVSRIAGTLAGLAVVGLVVLVGAEEHEAVKLGVFFVGVLVAIAFLAPNYSICVAGWTAAVLALISLAFPDITSLLGPRFLETVGGAALVLGLSYLLPTRMGIHAPTKLAATARALRDYSHSVIDLPHDQRADQRAALTQARSEAATAIAAASHELGSHSMPYEQAGATLANLVAATEIALALDEANDQPATGDTAITPASLERLDQLATRLESPPTQPASTPDTTPAQTPDLTDFARSVERAHQALGG